MIKRIEAIRDFGIYKNFIWNPDVKDFNRKNIFYGWNYSGKTTLSRIFSSLRNKEIHPDYKHSSFRILLDDTAIDSNNLKTFNTPIEVFNSDYINENLRWNFDKSISAIYFEVGDNAKASAQIEILEKKIDLINGTETIKGTKAKHINAINEFNSFESSIFTTEAKKIKNDYFLSLIEFTKAHLKKIIKDVISDLDSHIILDKSELTKLSKVVVMKEPKIKLDKLKSDFQLETILNLLKPILNATPSKSEIRSILEKDKNAFEWGKKGLNLHKKGDTCIFCDNIITDDRFDLLTTYYQNQASKLKEDGSILYDLIRLEENVINTFSIPFSFNDFNDGFQTEFKKHEKQLSIQLKKYKALILRIKNLLGKKIYKDIYTSISTQILISEIEPLINVINAINKTIDNNNAFIDRFEFIIEHERGKYKKHLVAKFLKQSKYLNKEKKFSNASVQLDNLNKIVTKYKLELNRLNAQKESGHEGCAQFNSFVQHFLSRDDIEIKLDNITKKFNLLRGSELAKNLSEGEKMAISFSHFLINLKSLEIKDTLKDSIIFIDDPMSSLDSNHIFQINSLLKDMFFDLSINPDLPNNGPCWNIKCKQLFISTHNFEFFNLLKELPKESYKKQSKYFISRKINEAIIEDLPKVYSSFASEYHYLFGEIVNFNNDPNKSNSPVLLTIPNILRRFVEMYTLTKYPSSDTVDSRAEKVFGKVKSKRILKLLHHFSHFNNIDRFHKHSEFVADIEYACADLIKLVKIDKMHYNALKASLN